MVKDWRFRVVLVFVSLACVLRVGSAQSKLPAEMAGYRAWGKLLPEPRLVPLELWQLCRSPTPEDWKVAAKTQGPHNQHFIQVYANPLASAALRQGHTTTLPIGSIIAKDKLLKQDTAKSEGTAVMIKRSDPKFAATGGWEFFFISSNGKKASVDSASCAACHQRATIDYVRGEYTF
jgi:hypothetical protein